ncbi:helix-turn-helix domain-containing protein [Alistipes sp. OttesenSCG-928-L06]|nr:helix-turn-helix domain-containing protein [Alistipes sp. OttesenSCG-928-L06]
MAQIVTLEEFREFEGKVLSTLEEIKSSVNNDSSTKKRWIRSTEVKALLNISHGKLQQMRDSGQIKFTRIGRVIFYDIRDIEKMMKEKA